MLETHYCSTGLQSYLGGDVYYRSRKDYNYTFRIIVLCSLKCDLLSLKIPRL